MSWYDLGSGTPTELGVWYAFDPTYFLNTRADRTYKITCLNVQPSDRFRTFCWMRFRWYDASTDEFYPTPQFKVYPSSEPLVREIALPQMLRDNPATVWVPEIEKRVRGNLLGYVTENNWGIKLEEWRPEGPPTFGLDPGEY